MKTRAELYADINVDIMVVSEYLAGYQDSTEALIESIDAFVANDVTRGALAVDPDDAEALAAMEAERPVVSYAVDLSRWLAARRTFLLRVERLERARAELNNLTQVEAN